MLGQALFWAREGANQCLCGTVRVQYPAQMKALRAGTRLSFVIIDVCEDEDVRYIA